MSHWTTVKTKISVKNIGALKDALKELFPENEIQENSTVRGYRSPQTARLVLRGKRGNYDIGFTEGEKGTLSIVTDWWGAAREFGQRENTINKIKQGYSKHVIVRQAKTKGFFIKETKTKEEGIRLHLTKY